MGVKYLYCMQINGDLIKLVCEIGITFKTHLIKLSLTNLFKAC